MRLEDKKKYQWSDDEEEKSLIIRSKKAKERIQKAKEKEIIRKKEKSKVSKRNKILISVVSVIVVLAVAAGVVFGYFGIKLDFSKTLATVNGAKIKQSEVDVYIEFLKNQDSTQVPAESDPQFKTLQANLLDSLIVLRLLEKYGSENNFAVTQKEVDDQYQTVVTGYASESAFEKDLVDKKISKTFLKNELKSQLLRDKIFASVTKNITLSDAEMQKYYVDNKETLFNVPEQIRVSHILIQFNVAEGQELTDQIKLAAHDKIKAIQDKLNAGGDFAALAKANSEDTASAPSGGDIGYISKGQTVAEFENAAFALKVGEVSGIVESSYGYHIIKVTEHKDPYIKTFDEVKDTIKSYIENDKKTAEWEKFVYSLIDKATIHYTTDLKGSLGPEGTTTESTTTETTTGTTTTETTGGSSSTSANTTTTTTGASK
jgi:parvulin-like peptidyl-prolyl isomerase